MSSDMDEESFSFAMQLINACTLGAALKSAIQLDLLELIKKAGPGAFVSPVELTAQIPTTNPDASDMVDRLLRLLATYNILDCRLRKLPRGGVERVYSLSPVSKYLTRNDAGASLAPLVVFSYDKFFVEAWDEVKNTVLEGGNPFERAHGISGFEYMATDPTLNKNFHEALHDQSVILMQKILEIYKGFDGLNSLVDVGGGTGACIKLILSKYPSIKAINFDLPYLIKQTPSHPGLENISGDMFDSVPTADAIFMKYILHDWGDEDCLKILRNCHKAIPENGKVIIAEMIVSEIPKSNDPWESTAITRDALMMILNTSSKERTLHQFQALAEASGFKRCQKICGAFGLWIMELHKN